MATFSFDIVSEYDKAEMNNAFGLAQKEISNRYDFKGTPAAIEWHDDKKGVVVTGASAWQVDAIVDLFRMKLAARSLSSAVLDLSKDIQESNMKARKEIPFKEGLRQEDAKRMTKLLKEEKPKVKTQIQGDAVRVSAASKDDLQACMRLIDAQQYDFPVRYINFR
jgi:cyclic-di-GMP-binding protein